jgi:hypothetical protein
MGIGSYKEAERYRMRTNKNLTRTFYLDTKRTLDDEPFAWEQSQDAGIMQQETVQEFNDGGRVEREGFTSGGSANIQKLSNEKYKFVSRRGGGQTSKTFDTMEEAIKFRDSYNEKYPKEKKKGLKKGIYGDEEKLKKLEQIILESNSDPFKSISREEAAIKAGYKSASNLESRVQFKQLLNTLVPLGDKFSIHLNNVMNNLDNIPYEDIVKAGGMNRYISKPFGIKRIADNFRINNTYMKPEFEEARSLIKILSNSSVLNSYGKTKMFAGEVIDNVNIKKSSQRLKGGNLIDDIIITADRSEKAGNKNIKFLTKPGSVDSSDIIFEWNGKLYGKNVDEYKGRKVNNLTTDIYKLPEFNEYLKTREDVNNLRQKEIIHPVTGKKTNYDLLLRETYAKAFNNKSYYNNTGLELDHLNIKDEPFSNLRALPKHINQTAGLIKKTNSIIEDKEKALKAIGYNIPEEALEDSILKFSDRVLNKNIPVSKTYDVGLRSITGASKEYLSPESKITTEGLKEGKVGTENIFKGETKVVTSSGEYRDVSPKERIDKTFNEWKKSLLEGLSEDTKNQVIGIAGGCPSEYANGGRVKFGKGSNCYINGLKNIEEGNLNKPKLNQIEKTILENNEMSSITRRSINVAKNAFNIAKGAGNIMEAFLSVGPGKLGLGLGLGVEAAFAYPELSRGDWREALRNFFPVQIAQAVGVPTGLNESRYDDIVDVAKDAGADVDKVKKFAEFGKNIEKEENLYKELEALQKAYRNPNDPDFIEQSKRFETKLKELNDYFNSNRFSSKELTGFGEEFSKASNYFAKKNIENIIPKNRSEEALLESQRRNLDVPFENVFGQNKEKMFNIIGLPKPPEPVDVPEEDLPDYYRLSAAEGGRIGFDKGGISKRGFLKLLGGTAATGAIAPDLIKVLKGGKTVTQVASKLKFEKAQGMYPWFPDLVEKIKTKGKPFEEKDLIMEASYKHEAKGYGGLPKGVEKLTKHVDGDTEFILREYPDGRIAVDIHSPRNQEGLDTPVTLYYRPTMELKYYSGTKVEPAEFKVLEKEPRYFANGPDDVDIEMSETRKIPGKNTIYGDVEAAERFATGKIENRKIIPVKQARRDQMEDAPVDFIEETSPYGPDTF